MGLVKCRFGVAHLLCQHFAGRSTLRSLCVVLGLPLRELGGSRRQLGRLPPLRFLQRRLRVGQLAREGVAVGEFLSEPDFELTLALRSVRGGLLFGRGALFGLLPRGRGVGQPEFERLPRCGRPAASACRCSRAPSRLGGLPCSRSTRSALAIRAASRGLTLGAAVSADIRLWFVLERPVSRRRACWTAACPSASWRATGRDLLVAPVLSAAGPGFLRHDDYWRRQPRRASLTNGTQF
jgi:hypothetical protein